MLSYPEVNDCALYQRKFDRSFRWQRNHDGVTDFPKSFCPPINFLRAKLFRACMSNEGKIRAIALRGNVRSNYDDSDGRSGIHQLGSCCRRQHPIESIDKSSGFSQVRHCLERHLFRRNNKPEAFERTSGRAGERDRSVPVLRRRGEPQPDPPTSVVAIGLSLSTPRRRSIQFMTGVTAMPCATMEIKMMTNTVVQTTSALSKDACPVA